MDEAGATLVLKAAKDVNPRIKVVIKFPNWYEHFQGLGFDLDKEPKMFDGIYTGTETRDPVYTDQFLQQYESYQIIRYFENIKPGGNGGGWVDPFGSRYVDRYAEQLWDTMFAKAREMTLFNWDLLLWPARPGERKEWENLPTSFNYNAIAKDYRPAGWAAPATPSWAAVAGASLRQADAVVGKLGTPIGIKSYKPYQSTGEDFLHNYIGMIGIPIDLYPEFPADAKLVLLTESAKFDPEIVGQDQEAARGRQGRGHHVGAAPGPEGPGDRGHLRGRGVRQQGARERLFHWLWLGRPDGPRRRRAKAARPLPRGAFPHQRRVGARERPRERKRIPDHAHGQVREGRPLRVGDP